MNTVELNDDIYTLTDDTLTLTGDAVPVRRARVVVDEWPEEPERGDGMWNEGVTLTLHTDDTRRQPSDAHPAILAGLERWYGLRERGHDCESLIKRYVATFYPEVTFCELMSAAGYFGHDDVWVLSTQTDGDAEAVARATFTEWESWAQGDVYGVIVEEYSTEDDEWVESDSCYGFYGDESVRSGVADMLEVNESDLPK